MLAPGLIGSVHKLREDDAKPSKRSGSTFVALPKNSYGKSRSRVIPSREPSAAFHGPIHSGGPAVRRCHDVAHHSQMAFLMMARSAGRSVDANRKLPAATNRPLRPVRLRQSRSTEQYLKTMSAASCGDFGPVLQTSARA